MKAATLINTYCMVDIMDGSRLIGKTDNGAILKSPLVHSW